MAEECGLGFNTIAGYCTGRHLPQLSVTAEFRRLLAAVGVPPGPEQEELLDALVSLRSPSTPAGKPISNPYRGLRPYRPEDAAVFFGRADLTAALLAELERCRDGGTPLVVVGPSGSGKSSLLRAGLMPAAGGSILMTPGPRPLAEWAARTGPLGEDTDTVVVVDQFEELFTLCPDERERLTFLTAIDSHPAPVVLGLRADFYDRLLRYPWLAELARNQQFIVEPMTDGQIRDVIREPARTVGLDVSDGLVELLLRDAAGEPGMLPLLSHTLHTIVELARTEQPPPSTLDVAHYRASGGIHGAVARSADHAYHSLGHAQQALARQLFLRLVNPGDAVAGTRRRVTFDELFDGRDTSQADDLAELLDVFVTHRLLTADADGVEISHEALIVAWPRLRDWLADDRAGHNLHRKLIAASRDWRDGGQVAELLYRGGVLAAAAEWAEAASKDGALNPLEREFLDASVAAEAARHASERRRVRRRYQVACVVALLLLAAAGAGAYARQTSAAAAREARMALSRQTATTAARLRANDPALAAQLALAAYRTDPTPEARSALLDSSARPLPRRIRPTAGTGTTMAAARDLVAIGTDIGQIQLLRTGADGVPRPTTPTLTIDHAVTALALSADGSLLAAGDRTGAVSAWRLAGSGAATPFPLAPTVAPRILSLAFSRDGLRLAAGTDGAGVRVWALRKATARPGSAGAGALVNGVAFTPDGRALAAGVDDGTVHLWGTADAAHPEPRAAFRVTDYKVFSVAISPDGRTLAAGTSARAVYLWNVTDPRHPVADGAPLTGPASWMNSVAFSPDGASLVAGNSDARLWQWDLRSRRVLGTLPHPSPVTGSTFQDARTLMTFATDGVTRRWNLPGPALPGSTKQVFSVSFDSDGHRLLIGSGDNSLRLWNLQDRAHPVLMAPPLGDSGDPSPLAGPSVLTADGRTVIAGTMDGAIRMWDLTDPGHPASLGPPLPVATEGTTRTIQGIVLSADGTMAAVSSSNSSVHLIDLTDRRHSVVLSSVTVTPGGTAFGVRFSPDGTLLAAVGADAKGYLWDIADRRHPRLLTTLTNFTNALFAVAFSADGTLLAFGGSEYTVRLVDLTRRDAPVVLDAPLVGPVGEVYEVSFSPTRPVLAISSLDGSIWLWDLRDPRRPVRLATLTAEGGLFTVGFAPDGRTLAAGGRDMAVRLWDTDPDSVATWICAGVGQPMTRAEWHQFLPDQPYAPPCR